MQGVVLVLALFEALEGGRGGASRDWRVEEGLEVPEARFDGLAGFTELLMVAGGSVSSSSLVGGLLARAGYAMQRIRKFVKKREFF
jgi:hypothetical protein